MVDIDTVALTLKDRDRLRRLRRAREDLYWLCTEVLGYDRLTKEFHGRLCSQWDETVDASRQLDLWPRGHYKTTIGIGRLVQRLLVDSNWTWLVCHAVDDEVQKIVEEAGTHFLKNKELRALLPEVMPSTRARRFLKANEFTLNRTAYNRQPSVLGKSVMSEITGAHVQGIWLDDIVGRKTIEDSGLPKVKSWYRNTVLPVLNPGGIVVVTGTRWDIADPYQDWLEDKDWVSRVRYALEAEEGVADYKGKPVLFSRKELSRRRKDMGPDFAPQMMQDPSPAGEKPWDPATCEHLIESSEIRGPGFVFVVSDPAPAKTGAFDDRGMKRRGDGSKDYWSNAVFKVRRNKMRQELILLDGSMSQEWDLDSGYSEICRLQRRWGAAHVAVEATGQAIALFADVHRRIARREGVAHNPIQLKGTYKGKNFRFANLASRAKNDELLICQDTVPEGFLDAFLTQARNWRPMEGGGNGLKFDDCADVVSMGTDAAFNEYAPQGESNEFLEWLNSSEDEFDHDPQRSRYCAA